MVLVINVMVSWLAIGFELEGRCCLIEGSFLAIAHGFCWH